MARFARFYLIRPQQNWGVTQHHYRLREDALFRLWHVVFAFLWLPVIAASAQIAPKDSSFRLGPCTVAGVDSTVWAQLVDRPDVRASLKRGPLPHPPLAFRDHDGNYRGHLVLTLMVDVTGHVVPGSVAVTASTESRLSLWGCSIAEQLQYNPATSASKPVLTIMDQPLSYSYGDQPPALKTP